MLFVDPLLLAPLIWGIAGAAGALGTLLKGWLERRATKAKVKLGGIEITVDLNRPNEAVQRILARVGDAQAFVSFSYKDLAVAQKLADDLKRRKIRVWLATQQIRPGDNLVERIQDGLRQSGYVLLVVTHSFLESRWAKKELEMIMGREQKYGWPRVIPLLFEEAELPEGLQEKVYLDFTADYTSAFDRLVVSIKGEGVAKDDSPTY